VRAARDLQDGHGRTRPTGRHPSATPAGPADNLDDIAI